MNIFAWFASRFIPCSEKEREAARKLLTAGRRQAVSGFKPLCGRYPALQTVGQTHKEAYDYYFTVAFAVMGMLGANMYFPPERRRGTTEAIKTELETWRRNSYGNDGHHLLSRLNLATVSAEVTLATWLLEQIARRADGSAEIERIRELKNDEGLLNALGHDIVTQAAESVVACFLEDKNR